MISCKRCFSYAINIHSHGRDGTEKELCDVCYWRQLAEIRLAYLQQLEKELKQAQNRIKWLEDIINRAFLTFFSDSSHRKVSIAMHRILEEFTSETKP
jgi:hypothetical protein